MVVVAQPRDLRRNVDFSLRFSLDRSQIARSAFPLVGRCDGVEGVGTKVRVGVACLCIDFVLRCIERTLPEGFATFEIAIAHGTIRTLITCAQTRGEQVAIGELVAEKPTCFPLSCAIRTTSRTGIESWSDLSCDNVDGTRKSLSA